MQFGQIAAANWHVFKERRQRVKNGPNTTTNEENSLKMQIQYRSSAKAADVADVAVARATCDEQPAIEGVVSRNLLPTCLRNGGGCGAVVQWVVAGLEAPPPG